MLKTKNILRVLRDMFTYWQTFSTPEKWHEYRTKKITSEHDEDFIAAKRLHAAVYLSRGFIDSTDIQEGMIHSDSDPHQHHAQYFVVKRGREVVAVARQITYKGVGAHHESFPLLTKAFIHERSRRRILAMHPHEITEISALVKRPGESPVAPLLLYREMWRHSLASRHRIWVMACDVRLYQRLKILFGPTLVKIGQRTPYKGGDVIPAALQISSALTYVQNMKSRRNTRAFDIHRRAALFITQPELVAKHRR